MTYEFNEIIGQSMTTYEKPSKNQSEHDIYGILSWISENYPFSEKFITWGLWESGNGTNHRESKPM